MVAVAVFGIFLLLFTGVMSRGIRFLRESDAAGEALRLAEAQIEAVRALPPGQRPAGADLPALTGAEALDRLPGGTCAVTVVPFDAAATPSLMRVRVRVAWDGEGGRRELGLCTVVGPARE